MAELPLAPVKGLSSRQAPIVSQKTQKKLRDELEGHAEDRARDAKVYAEHAGRKTVQADDIKASR